MRSLWLCALLLLALSLSGQINTIQQVNPSSFTYYSYGYQTPVNPPLGSTLLLNFPNQATGGQLSIQSCSTYSNLKYNHFTYSGGNWTGPATGPVYGYFTNFYATVNPSNYWLGISADLSFEGALGSNTNQSTQNFIQSFYFSTDNCYEYGPEFGFYRLLTDPASSSQLQTVYFYYGINVNCYNVGALGSCRDKVTGQSLQYNAVTTALTVPRFNSKGTSNYTYTAYLDQQYEWRVQVIDPYSGAFVINQAVSINPTGFFASTATTMFQLGLSGYATITQQRNSAKGGITDSMSNPLKITTYALFAYMVSHSTVSPALAGMQPASGWCSQGGQGISAPSVTGGVNIFRYMQQSYPSCTVKVFNAGTSTLATIFSNNNNVPTPLTNPFTAQTNGFYQFYAPNGAYDIQLSGGGLPAPISVGTVELFDFSTWVPTNFYVRGNLGVISNGTNFVSGFSAVPGLTQSTIWTLPANDAQGCWASNGIGNLSIIGCGVAGTDMSVQYNKAGSFGGDSNFIWDYTNRLLTLSGVAGTPTLTVNTGFILAGGGIVTNANSWQGFNTNTDGGLFRGVAVAPNTAGNAGGYINIAPLGYAGDLPLPLPGLSSFGAHTALLWVSGTNPAAPDTTLGLNTNLYINAAGGFNTQNTYWNSVQASGGGGMFANSFTALHYVQTGHSNGPPSVTGTGPGADTFHQGALYWDDGLGGEQVFNGSAWVAIGSGGGGGSCPAGATTTIQYNAGSSTCGGSSNFYWNNALQLAVVNALDAAHAGISIVTGFAQADAGFLATAGTATNYNAFQAAGGGFAGKSFTATAYVQTGNHNGTPTLTSGDSFHAGAMYYDTGAASEQVYTGSAWVSLGGGSGTPGGPNTSIQYNASGSFAGSANLYWDNTNQLLVVNAIDAAHAGMNVVTGFMQADAGFLATTGTATNYNAFQAAGGGFAGKNFTATKYIQAGHGSGVPALTSGDAFHAGALYYDDLNTCLEVYNGSAWACTGSGGGGTPGGPNTSVQFNNSGAFAGSANYTWNNASQLLTVTGIASTAGIAVANGYIQSDGGFLVSSSNQYNSIQTTANGGMAARSFTAGKYVQTGTNNGAPSATTSDTINAGSLYWDTGLGAERVFNGSTWLTLGTVSSGVSSLNALTGALSIVGTTNEITVTPAGSTITLATPQPIATSSNVTFANVTAGVFSSTNTGSSISFQNSNFQINGAGAASFAGVVASTGASGGFNITGNSAFNSFQTIGGISAGNTSLASASAGTFQNDSSNATVFVQQTGGSGSGIQVASNVSSTNAAIAVIMGGSAPAYSALNTGGGYGFSDISVNGSSFSKITNGGHYLSTGSSPTTPTATCSMDAGSTDTRGGVSCGAVNSVQVNFAVTASAQPYCTANASGPAVQFTALSTSFIVMNASVPANHWWYMCMQ